VRLPARGRSTRGQSLVEFAVLVPVFLMILLGMLEYGIMFNRHITIEYSTREGARTGAALANGGGARGCAPGQSPNAANVDPQIIAATERVLKASGASVNMSLVSQIRIYKAAADGTPVAGKVNTWTYSAGAGPVVDGEALDYVQSGAPGWTACSRDNGSTPESLGVAVTYRYDMTTPLAGLLGITSLTINDKTVMALNPTGV
jgi:Flp pilus assembly protein TadG